MAETKKPSVEEKIWGASSYLWVLSLVVLAARKNNNFVRFHANQGLLLFALSIPFIFIPLVGWFVNLLIAVACIAGIIKSLQGEKWELPLLAETAKTFGNWVAKTIKL
ncbi:MAG TPA: hypothetical protein PKL09_03905 [bacterium]|nr:hypothetical protein [bacterium]HNS34421.1 hypothetical protein [bacterium]HNW09418.1 hypothetical protein [bacterium]HNZ73625.1 hypothetical protein [bacterium]HOH67586.1 hypothetical protein [bacterium]